MLTAGLSLLTMPLIGCATTGAGDSEHQERKAFIAEAMRDLDDQLRAFSDARKGRGSAAAMSLTKLVPFGDFDYYYVGGGDLAWRPNAGQTFEPVEVLEGFVTDLTSIPRAFWQIGRPEGRYAYAAVVHDYLYWTQSRPREEADQILKFAMEDSNVAPWQRWAIYQGVDKLGKSAWERNRRLKMEGERRMLAKYPTNLSISWAEWKKEAGSLK